MFNTYIPLGINIASYSTIIRKWTVHELLKLNTYNHLGKQMSVLERQKYLLIIDRSHLVLKQGADQLAL